MGAGLYLGGWAFLLLGSARDPRMKTIGLFMRSTTGIGAALATCLFLQVIAIGFSSIGMLVSLLACATCFFGFWVFSKTAKGLEKWIARLLLFSVSLGAAFFVGEIIFNLPSVSARTLPPAFVKVYRDEWCRENYDRLWENNPHSFRSLHLDHPKARGTVRIVTLGDSFTWGDKIGSTKNIWPYALEKTYREKGMPVEVINLAKCGYTTVNEAEMLERFGWQFEPDLVVLQFFLNDPLPSGPNFQCKSEDWMQAPARLLLPFMHRTLDRESYFYSLMNQRFAEMQRRLFHRRSLDYNNLFADDFAGWKDCRSALQKMAESAKKRRIPMLVLIFPFFQGGLDDGSYPWLALHDKIKSAAAENGLGFLDLRPRYARINPKGRFWWAIPLDTHPGIETHRVAAQAVAEELDRLGISARWQRGPKS